MNVWTVLGLGILVLAVVWLAVGYGFFCYAVRRHPQRDTLAPGQKHLGQWGEYLAEIRAGANWIESQPCEELTVRSFDGLRLYGRYFPCKDSQKTALLFHGYRAIAHNDFAGAMKLYHDSGYNILLVDERAHGKSEGRFLGYGVLERRDVLAWAGLLDERFDHTHTLVLAGLSMGAATVLMSLGLPLPKSVKGAVADCGFTSPWDILSSVAKARFRLPDWLAVSGVDLWCRLLAGYSLKGASTCDALAKATVPVLFIHGERDDFVPYAMSRAGYDACVTRKEFFSVPGASHAVSCLVDAPGYAAALRRFLASLG